MDLLPVVLVCIGAVIVGAIIDWYGFELFNWFVKKGVEKDGRARNKTN